MAGQLMRTLGHAHVANAFRPAAARQCAYHRFAKSQPNSHSPSSVSWRRPASTCRFVVQASHSSTSTAAEAAPVGDKGHHEGQDLPMGSLTYTPPKTMRKFLTSLKLFLSPFWRKFKKGSVLVIEVDGDIPEQRGGRFALPLSVPQLKEALMKAAYDPRIRGIHLKIGSVSAGWAKLQELRRSLDFFRTSGKFSIATMNRGGEKEYFLCCGCEEIYIPPTANLTLKGFMVAGTFLRGVLEKVGIEPQVKRIGKYKSAGDQLLLKDMSEPQREQLTALLEDIYEGFTSTIAKDRSKTVEEVEAMLNEGIFDMQKYVDGGWVTGLKYEDEVMDDLKKRTGGKADKLRSVSLKKYGKTSPSAFGLTGRKTIAIVRSSGAIVGGEGGIGGTGSVITAGAFIKQLRSLAKDKSVKAVVLRVDSPGGDALASDLMWREIRQLAAKKPVVASMGDVAASGGYYMAMGASKIVAEPLTITGSIGVVTGKFNLEELYRRVQYSKVVISKGKYAELNGDTRSFTPEEEDLFDRSAEFAYASFRDKAAESRGMPKEELQQHAQGRVWSGKRALQNGLIDGLGGIDRAISIAKQAAGIDQNKKVRLLEVSKAKSSPFGLLSALALGGAMATGEQSSMHNLASMLLAGQLQKAAFQNGVTSNGVTMAVMPDIQVEGVGSLSAAQACGADSSRPDDLSSVLQRLL
ncbi:hypothetical protein WJX77_008755 [Trebouxia sp. C0004]